MTLGGKFKKSWIRAAVSVLVLSALGVGFAGVQSASASEADTLVSLVNQNRAQAGLGPLRHNAAMDGVALRWAQQMAASNSMTHNPSYSSQIPAGWGRAGENIAMGQRTPAEMEAAWWASPGHHANIVGDYTDVGVAFFTDASGQTWGVQDFAKYGNASVAAQPAPVAAAPRASAAAPVAAPAKSAKASPVAGAPVAPAAPEVAPVVAAPVEVAATPVSAAAAAKARTTLIAANGNHTDGLTVLNALNMVRTASVTPFPIGYIFGGILVGLGLAGGIWSSTIRRRGHRARAAARTRAQQQ